MGEHNQVVYEPGLMRIFRLFCSAVSAVFFIFAVNPPLLFVLRLSADVNLFIGLAYLVVAVYLMIPAIEHRLGRFYLPAAIVATIIIPILSLSWQPYLLEGPYVEMLLSSSYSISILLMFPLIITAWQYNFRMVIIFFLALGAIDPLIYLIIGRPSEQSAVTGIYSSLVRVVSFMAIGFVVSELMKNQREKRKELARANQKLKEQAHVVQELSVTRERNRIAHELHDVLAHTLSSLAVQLEATKAIAGSEHEDVQQMLDRALENARQGLKETRRTVRNLRAEPLEELGFQQALNHLCRDAENRGGFSVDIKYTPHLDAVDFTWEHHIYRIIQETLENIIAHAHASHVILELKQTGKKTIQVIITDDGRGFDPARTDTSGHFGIATMKERSESMGANFQIHSEPGSGTTVLLTLRDESIQEQLQ
jgi:signal transduction histidine kinase